MEFGPEVNKVALSKSRMVEATPFFYGWVVLGAGTAGLLLMGPSQTFTVSVFIEYWVTDLGLSSATISLLYGLATLAASALLPVTGWLLDRLGSRTMMGIASLGLITACMGLSRADGLLSFALVLFLLRFFGFGTLQLASSNAIAQWFVRKRGFVMGISNQSLALGLILYPWLSEALIEGFGWRNAWVGLGLFSLLLFPLSAFFIRDTPERFGLRPDGDSNMNDLTSGQFASEVNWRLSEARRTLFFWLFLIGFMVITMGLTGLVFHQFTLFSQQSLPRSLAVNAFQMAAIFTMIGSLGGGKLFDIISPRLLMALTLGTLAAAMMVAQNMTLPIHGYLFGMLLGLTGGANRVLDASIWAHYFGRRYLGSIRGLTMIGTLGGTALGAYPLGLSLDYLGSYAPALVGMLVLQILMIAGVLWVPAPVRAAPAGS